MFRKNENFHFDAVYSSPLRRALNTARIASGRNDVITDDRLIEVDLENWEGKTKQELLQKIHPYGTIGVMIPLKTKAGGVSEKWHLKW